MKFEAQVKVVPLLALKPGGGGKIVIRSGTISDFLYGIRVEATIPTKKAEYADISGITVDGGTARGFAIIADRARVTGNTVRNLTGFKAWRASNTIGIEVSADECEVYDNNVEEIYPEGLGETIAIALSTATQRCFVKHNRVDNRKEPKFGRGIAFWVASEQRDVKSTAIRIEKNRISGFTYAFMAPEGRKNLFSANKFRVSCVPGDVQTYGEAKQDNMFLRFGEICSDSLSVLKRRSTKHGCKWTVRLAAALIEGQWLHRKLHFVPQCKNAERAKKLLIPLAKGTYQMAIDQLRRANIVLAGCQPEDRHDQAREADLKAAYAR